MKHAPATPVPADHLRQYAERIEGPLSELLGATVMAEGEFPAGMSAEAKRAIDVVRKNVADIFETTAVMRAVGAGLYDDVQPKPTTKPKKEKARAKK